MAIKVMMPKLSPTMEEGQIARWVANEGETVKNGDTLCEIDTDKATMEMTSLNDGTLLKILRGAGEVVLLGDIIAVIGKPDEDISAILAEAASPKPQVESQPKEIETPVAKTDETKVVEVEVPKVEAPKTSDVRLLVSPIAARMASENGVDLRNVVGSGPSGRIIKRDIETVISAQSAVSSQQLEARASSIPPSAFRAPQLVGASAFRDEPTTKMRRVIASRLAESIGPIPTFYLTVEIEMDNALALRKQINANLSDEAKISVNDIIVKVTAMSLTKHPFVNASFQDTAIRFYEDADIGVAVAVEDGLITPVVRSANKKGFGEISAEIKEMAKRARERKLQPEEYTGATFSISNLGMMGIKEFTAIINPPEAAIFAIGGATPTPVVRDGEIVVRNIMNVTMSCDHRVIDGATGAKFLQTFKQMLENPLLMLL